MLLLPPMLLAPMQLSYHRVRFGDPFQVICGCIKRGCAKKWRLQEVGVLQMAKQAEANLATGCISPEGHRLRAVAESSSRINFFYYSSFFPKDSDEIKPSNRVKKLVSSFEGSEASEGQVNPAIPRSSFSKRSRAAKNLSEKNAVGALDGTFIKLTVPAQDRSRYRSRKDEYYLVDAGYTNGPGFLAPFRATRYHLNEWRGNTPRYYKELFNLRHIYARNAIERSFGLLKKRWAILRTACFYDLKTQIRIINVCCIIHNFIREEMPEDPLLDEVDQELGQRVVIENDSGDQEEQIMTVRTTREWTMFRKTLAMQMYEEYRARRRI
ncbi:uncharacterized protein [Henckelia pumila]|uniref:uncharacterized protein n=1 Tax=Henckelia pumila TaxID=405737 RepID=UPI003C6DE06B